MKRKPPIVLTIAGSDSGGGAGIQADLKTFEAHGCFGTSAVTAVTAQNTVGVRGVEMISPEMVRAQIAAVMEDLGVAAIKTGMLGSVAVVKSVAEWFAMIRGFRVSSNPGLRPHRPQHLPIVIDPVMVATSGDLLLEPEAREVMLAELIPHATLLTPNIPEAEHLSGGTVTDESSMQRAAERLLATGCRAVLVKGGHGGGESILDLLVESSGLTHRVERPRLTTRNTHGTGCTLSAAIACRLAGGDPLPMAVEHSIDYVRRAIQRAPGFGQGHGPPGFREE